MDISTLIFILEEIRGEYGNLGVTLGYDEDSLEAEDIVLKPPPKLSLVPGTKPATVNIFREEY